MSKKLLTDKNLIEKPLTFPAYPGVPSESTAITASIALREAKRVNDSSFDRIWKYYYEPKKNVALSEHEEEVRLRLLNVWQLLTGKILNDRKAVMAHITWCKENFMTITERTAYDDLRRAKALFGDPRVSTAVFEKARISAVLLDLIKKASDADDLDNAQRLIRRYNAVNGLEDDIKTQLPRPAITINFNADPDTLKKQAAELMEGVTIDTDFTEGE